MVRDEAIVCLSLTPWDSPIQSCCHYLMREFARHNRVLFVDRALSLKDLVSVERDASMRSRLERTTGRAPRLRPASEVDGDLWVLTPPPAIAPNRLPAGSLYDLVARASGTLLRWSVARALEYLGMRPTVVWVGFDLPAGTALAGKLGERVLVYHCYDEVKGWPYLARHGRDLEERLLMRADVVFATSPALLRQKKELAGFLGARAMPSYLPNGVDHPHFARALLPETPVFPDLAGLPGPIAGYLGNIEDRVDFALLEALAGAIPEGTLVIAGPAEGHCRGRLAILETLPNVKVLGTVPPPLAPQVLKAFDVGLIPFRRSTATAHMYPLKANEYLAAGKPVVATDFADLSDLAPHVRVASSTEEFLALVRKAAAENRPGSAYARSRFAAANSWRNRAEQASAAIAAVLRESVPGWRGGPALDGPRLRSARGGNG